MAFLITATDYQMIVCFHVHFNNRRIPPVSSCVTQLNSKSIEIKGLLTIYLYFNKMNEIKLKKIML